MVYLQLLPIAEFSYFGKDGCVFHLLNQKRFPCDEKMAALLDELLQGKAYIESEQEEDFKQYLSQSMKEGMLYPYSAPVYHEAYQARSSMEIRGLFEEPPQMREVFIQGAGACNYNCKYCKLRSQDIYVSNGCRSCIQWGDLDASCKLSDRLEDVKRILQLHHSRITISGGNLFLEWEETRRMIEFVIQESPSADIHIVHNGTMLSEEILNYLKEHDICVEIMAFGYDEASWLEVTGNNTAFKEWNELFLHLQKLHIHLELISIGNEKYLDQIKKFVMQVCGKSVYDIVEISETAGGLRTVLPYSERTRLPLDDFFERKRFNRCLYGKLALTMKGRIQPCPMLEDTLVDLLEQEFEYIFQNQIVDQYWRMTRKDVPGCGQCPYQWLCSDCMKAVIDFSKKNRSGEPICRRIEPTEGGEGDGAFASTIGYS